MKKRIVVAAAAILTLGLIPVAIQAQGGLMGRIKDKAKEKVEQRAEDKADKAMDKALDKVECIATDEDCCAPRAAAWTFRTATGALPSASCATGDCSSPSRASMDSADGSPSFRLGSRYRRARR